MSKEAEILRRCISCHYIHLCQKSSKSKGVMYLRFVSLTKNNSSSTTDPSPDENCPIFPGFTQLRSGKIAMEYRLRKTYF